MAFIFKIKLDGTAKPPVWRKVKVNESTTFDDFHIVIQILFGWNNSHMYQFSPKGYGSTPNIRYQYEDDIDDYYTLSPTDTFPFGEYYDSEAIKLNDYFATPKQKMIYIYDFGDNWKHLIELIDITDEKVMYPVCTGGKGQSPFDDCGGIWGYYNMVEAVNDSKHPDHKHYVEWLGFEKGENWDLHAFDKDDINNLLIEVMNARNEE